MGRSKEQMNWLGGAGRGRGQGKRAGQMSQPHMPFVHGKNRGLGMPEKYVMT